MTQKQSKAAGHGTAALKKRKKPLHTGVILQATHTEKEAAATLSAGQSMRSAEEVDGDEDQYGAKLMALLASNDYDGASILKEERLARRVAISQQAAQAPAMLEATLDATLKVATPEVEMYEAQYAARLTVLLANEDYDGAAALKRNLHARRMASSRQAQFVQKEAAAAALLLPIETHYSTEPVFYSHLTLPTIHTVYI